MEPIELACKVQGSWRPQTLHFTHECIRQGPQSHLHGRATVDRIGYRTVSGTQIPRMKGESVPRVGRKGAMGTAEGRVENSRTACWERGP